ncbi:MAG: Repeat domain in Vibrio, Colwellia, Bradyrhizobium and Shewanella [Rhodobacteraceae bacterium HLUCCO18]|nr:MAG: Repeat domain in Vibrio, Colwellia, Bradyrhizobium and Shewanella [Rhodobacteraceae bacterium HLUCCO18]
MAGAARPAAPRPLSRFLLRFTRGAGLALSLCVAAPVADAQTALSAVYEDPTTRYPHGALGDTVEHATLTVTLSDGRILRATWDAPVVFEDTAPRLADLDGDGRPEILTVEAHETQGARFAIWAVTGDDLVPLAATPWIGQRFRWLAPLGAADLDGDGRMEIAYVDRPHLAKILRVWRITFPTPDTATLTEIATAPGLTNHRLRDPEIPGGIRHCADGPEMITADADWTRVIATRLTSDGTFISRDIGPWRPGALNAALACPN